ncbi:SDR family oxidoreductase [Bradyrhizobium sp. AUGA SZCCT0182]|uniref:SDR family oxidoreductase n=1 Tax=Bradyrhizobium sp. AUGA SZCCT0182 TaxID=2807667 RepID=UPI00390CC712
MVNNAGAVPSGSLFDVDEARWRSGWDLKVFGYINMCRTFYPLMVGRGGGTIVNIAGIGAIVKSPAAICIAAGNAAIIVMSQTLGSGSHRDHVRMVAVNPGPVATERLKAAASVQDTQKFNAAALLPWAHPASVEEIGATVAFLASRPTPAVQWSPSTADCPRPPRASNAFLRGGCLPWLSSAIPIPRRCRRARVASWRWRRKQNPDTDLLAGDASCPVSEPGFARWLALRICRHPLNC